MKRIFAAIALSFLMIFTFTGCMANEVEDMVDDMATTADKSVIENNNGKVTDKDGIIDGKDDSVNVKETMKEDNTSDENIIATPSETNV